MRVCMVPIHVRSENAYVLYTIGMLKIVKEYKRFVRLVKPSAAEQRFYEVMGIWWIIRYRPKREYRLSGYYIDFALPKQQIAIEIDGAAYHKDVVGAWERDARRDYHLRGKGWITLRIPARDVFYHPKKVKYTVKFFLIHGKKPTKYPKSVLTD